MNFVKYVVVGILFSLKNVTDIWVLIIFVSVRWLEIRRILMEIMEDVENGPAYGNIYMVTHFQKDTNKNNAEIPKL